MKAKILNIGVYVLLTVLIAACSSQGISPYKQPRPNSSVSLENRPANKPIYQTNKDQSKGKTNKKEQQFTWKPANIKTNRVRLAVGKKSFLKLKTVKARVKVDGFRARVNLEYSFFNHHNKRLEGTFKLRLPNGASPHSLSFGQEYYQFMRNNEPFGSHYSKTEIKRLLKLDNQKRKYIKVTNMKSAIMVPQTQAARAFATTVRRRIDPALLEWTGAGVFNGRVYPLEAKTLHKITITYDVDLTESTAGLHLDFILPKQSEKRSLEFNIAKKGNSNISINNMKSNRSSSKRIYFQFKQAKKSLYRLTLRKPATVALTGHDHTGSYFTSRLIAKLPQEKYKRISPHAVFLLDTSLSSNGINFDRSIQLLIKILSKNETRLKRFAVMTFNVRQHWWRKQFVENTALNRAELKIFLNSLVLEGATDIERALREASRPSVAALNTNNKNLFMISDGAITWGQSNHNSIVRLLKKQLDGNRLFIYSTIQSGVNASLLTRLANITGGAYYSVNSKNQLERAAQAFLYKAWKLNKITIPGIRDIIVRGRPKQLYPNQRIIVAGRGKLKANSHVRLWLSNGKQVKVQKIRIDKLIRSPLAIRGFGQIAVRQMESLQQSAINRTVQKYALHFRVVGKNATLLMLESRADYKRFNINKKTLVIRKFIRINKARQIINKLIATHNKNRYSEKIAFKTWITRLSNTAGVNFTPNRQYLKIIDSLPERKFSPQFIQSKTPSYTHKKKSSFYNFYARALKKEANHSKRFVKEYKKRIRKKQRAKAIVALSNLVELEPGKSNVLRKVSYHLISDGFDRDAYFILKKMIERKPYEPQAYLALARLALKHNQLELALLYYQFVLQTKWDQNVKSFISLAKIEYSSLIQKLGKTDLNPTLMTVVQAEAYKMVRSEVVQPDLMFSIEWNTDGTRIGLNVKEPNLETRDFRRRQGKLLSADWMNSYGPHIYRINQAERGEYNLTVNYWQNLSNKKKNQTDMLLTIYRNLGKNNQSIKHKVVSFTRRKGDLSVWNETIKE